MKASAKGSNGYYLKMHKPLALDIPRNVELKANKKWVDLS